MSRRNQSKIPQIPNQDKYNSKTISLLDLMEDGKEFASMLQHKKVSVNLATDIKLALSEIVAVRNRPCIVYVANMVNNKIKESISIDYGDDLPFEELINTIPKDIKDIDILLVTPGGSGTQVAKFVDKLRPRFDNVSFILPDMAMSAGTIFAMSGDEIIMNNRSYIGPIDPQVPNRDGAFVPAQSILTLIEDIREKGQNELNKGRTPSWTDLQILNQIDKKEIGNAINASKYSVELVENYLYSYKFKTWTQHSDGITVVTDADKKKRANEIASQLCEHSLWKSHGRGITREVAWDICKLRINHAENTEGLDRAMRRVWALFYWIFENTGIYKIFVSEYYMLLRTDANIKV